MYPVAFSTTPCGALPALNDFTLCTSTSVAAFTFSDTRRHVPRSTKTSTPPMIHRVAHFEGSAERRLARSIFRFLSSASIQVTLHGGRSEFPSWMHSARERLRQKPQVRRRRG